MINLISSIPTVLTILLLGCGATFTNNEKITGYNLTKPDNTFLLPDTLHEVSGLTDIDSTIFACIQDENGILFIYDAKNNVKKEIEEGMNEKEKQASSSSSSSTQ